MGSIHIAANESKIFKKCIPAICKVIFSSPVKDGILFSKLLDEAIKKQIFVNDEGEERYNKSTMKDEDGHVIGAFLDRNGNQMRLYTGQPTEDEHLRAQEEYFKERNAREARNASGGGGGGASKAEIKEMVAIARAEDKEEKRLQDTKDKERREEKDAEEKDKHDKARKELREEVDAQQKVDKERTSAQSKCEVYVQFMAQWKACQTQEERDALAAKLTVPTLRPILQHLNKFTSGNEEI